MAAPDPYWQATIDELQRKPDLQTVAPGEFKEYIPALLAYDEAQGTPQRIVCHKGQVDRLPTKLLAACFGRAHVAFANEVFVVYEIADAADAHVRSFEVGLAQQFLAPPRSAGLLLRRAVDHQPGPRVPRIVAALQSPTLLNIWATSASWTLEVAELGDHAGLAESALLTAPRWDGHADNVTAVLVTTPYQLEQAEALLPHAAKLWVLHRAQRGLLPLEFLPRVDGIVTLSRRVLYLQRTLHEELLEKPAWVLPPAYSPQPRHGWKEDVSWLMKSRPSTRASIDAALLQQTFDLLKDRGVRPVIYGQDTEGGFLDNAAREALYRACSCYLSPLAPWAGFGLAQHECLAAGIPIAGLIWGDLHEDLKDYTGLCSTLDDVADQAARLCSDPGYARTLSEMGLDYIAERRTQDAMDSAIRRLVEELPAS